MDRLLYLNAYAVQVLMEQVLHAHHAQEDIIVLVMVHENFVQQDYMRL